MRVPHARCSTGRDRACERCCRDLLRKLYRPQRDASLLATARELIERFNARRRDGTAGSGDRTIHIVGAFGKIGGSEHRAYGLHALLSPYAPVRLWSTVPPLPELLPRLPIETIDAARGVFPQAGHLVFVGVYFDWGDWWRGAGRAG